MYISGTTVQVTNTKAVLFVVGEFAGMVGESVTSYDAFLIDYNNPVPTLEKLEYEQLRENYKLITGRDDRVKFWYLMKEFSPARIEERQEEETADAINRVI
jgi:hypothetical protein